MRLVLLVKKRDGLGEKTVFESGSRCLDAPVTSTRRQQREQSMAWVAVVLHDFLRFPKAGHILYDFQSRAWVVGFIPSQTVRVFVCDVCSHGTVRSSIATHIISCAAHSTNA